MSILVTLPNTTQMPLGAMAISTEVTAYKIPIPSMANDYCWCSWCPYGEVVFSGANDTQTDKSQFLFKGLNGSDTVEMTLWKNGTQIDLLDNNDNGNLFDFGFAATQPYYKGYEVNWGLVYALHGAGSYQIKCTYTQLGFSFNYESQLFKLMGWNSRAADGTVRIETYQNGLTESDIFDFTNINWYQSMRLRGSFLNKQPNLGVDNYLDSERNRVQIQDSITNSYTLTLPKLAGVVKDTLIEREILANEIFITDYNQWNDDVYKRLSVYATDIESVKYRLTNPGASVIIKFAAREENIVKRNNFFGTNRVTAAGVCLPSLVTVNGTLMGSVASGGTFAQLVKTEAGAQTGSKVGNDWIIPNSEYDVDIVDRWGNSLPQLTDITANTSVNHSTYNFISELIARESTADWGGSSNVTAIGAAITAIVNAGLWTASKLQYINFHAGITASSHSWNARYPYAKRSAYQSVFGLGVTHDKYGIVFPGAGDNTYREDTYFSPLIHSDLNSFAFGVTLTSHITNPNTATQNMLIQNNIISSENRGCQLSVRLSDSRVLYKCNSPGGTGPNYTPGAPISDFTGYGFDVVRVASNEIHLYMNGSLVGTTANTSTNDTSSGENRPNTTMVVGNAGAISAYCKMGTTWMGSLTQAEAVTLRGIIATLETTLRA